MGSRPLRIGLVAALASAGCTGILDGGESRVLGTVQFYSDPVVIEVPDSVHRAEDFVVTVRTYGGGCERIGPTESETRADTIFVAPYDFTTRGVGTECTAILRLFDHSITLSWPSAGDLTVVIRGMEEPSGQERRYVRRVAVR